jgi:predicted anti-sigma-YlaC factor YlaD
MNCKKNRLKLERYISQELISRDYTLVSAHLKKCKFCQEELQTIQQLFRISGLHEKKLVTNEFSKHLCQSTFLYVEELNKHKERIRHWMKFGLVPAALSLAAVLLVVISLNLMGFLKPSSSQEFLVKDVSVFEVLYVYNVYNEKPLTSLMDISEEGGIKP